LRPRCNGWQQLRNFSLSVHPEPFGISQVRDLDGNNFIKVWFDASTETTELLLETVSEVETLQENPFNYLLESWALKLPIDYPTTLFNQLQPYLQPYNPAFDPAAVQLAQEISHKVKGNTILFLSTLNQQLYANFNQIVRETEDLWLPGLTWRSQQGSCRDTALLFMETCRAIGLAARFVSGYQEGDPEQEQRDLHAWVEAYLPGAGWLGYDPTHGLVIADRHVALAASAIPQYAAPVVGHFTPARTAYQMEAHIAIEVN
jgi:transglutaminase-like putative cysteine protease